MRCKKLIKILPKYVNGELSERRSALVREHIRNCPDCAAEAQALEKMRSLLRTAGAVEAPEAYWDTYWDRLEKKLPHEPLPFRMRSRMWTAIAAPFRQPAAVARIAAYVILLALLVYIVAPDRIFKEAPESRTYARMPAETAREEVFNEDLNGELRDDKSEAVASIEVRRLGDMDADAGDTVRRDAPGEILAGHAMVRDEISLDSEAPKTESESLMLGKELAPAISAPEKPVIAVDEPVADLRYNGSAIADEDAAKSKDEYVNAENYFKQGQYLQAIPAYQNFITANVKDERAFRAQYQIAESYYQAGNYPDALSNFAVLTDSVDPEKGQEKLQAAAQTPDANAYFYDQTEEKKAEVATKPVAEAQSRIVAEDRGVKAKRGRAAGREAGFAASKEAGAAGAKDKIPETREELISRAIFRQAQSYENLGNVQEALNKYNQYLAGSPKGVYVIQAKEKIEKIGKQQSEKADKKKTDDKKKK